MEKTQPKKEAGVICKKCGKPKVNDGLELCFVCCQEMRLKDRYETYMDVYGWEYYANGTNPDRIGYQSEENILLWNTTVTDQGHKIFQGDLSKTRIDFLRKLSQDHTFYIFSEYKEYPPICIEKGTIYGMQKYLVDSKTKEKLPVKPWLDWALGVVDHQKGNPDAEIKVKGGLSELFK